MIKSKEKRQKNLTNKHLHAKFY